MATRKKAAPVKPARSVEEQLQRLSQLHGLTIEDDARAEEILKTVNYYRLTTYGKHLRRTDDPERFVDGVSLEALYALYSFDMGLRHQILPVLEFFEIQLRAKIAYQLAMAHGSLGYMDEANFRPERLSNGSLVHRNLIGKFKQEVRRQGALPFVRHHKAKYGGQFPIWAAVELFTFGMLSSLYDIMLERDQRAVSGDYSLSHEALAQLIRCAVDVRNICAHYNRLYNQPLEEQPMLLAHQKLYESDKVFPLLLALRGAIGRERVYQDMVAGIARLIEAYPQADPALCGFPKEWERLLDLN